jgi:hypothetical protein
MSTSPRSPEQIVAARQQAEVVAAALLDCFRQYLVHHSALFTQFPEFLDRFECAGRRLDQLRPEDRVLCDLAMVGGRVVQIVDKLKQQQAQAARVSSLPLILGASAPDIKHIASASDGTDLSFWGKRREAFCRTLEDRARRHLEQSELPTTTSVEAITALMAIQTIEDSYATQDGSDMLGPRPFSAAAIEQLRHIALKTNRTPLEERALHPVHGIVRSVAVADAMICFNIGKPMQFSDDDLALLRPELLTLQPEDLLLSAASSSPSDTLDSIFTLGDHLCVAARHIHRHITGPRAQRAGPPTASVIDEIREMLEVYLGGCDLFDSALAGSASRVLIALGTVRYGAYIPVDLQSADE